MRTIPEKESLTVEFKSDQKRLPDRDLVAAAVCLANTEGGDLYLGVEKDGAITGLHPLHQNLTGLAALIANHTIPPLSVRVESLEIAGKRIAKIAVPKSTRLVSTSEGLLQRRRLMLDGTPQCVPFYPHEFVQRQADLGLMDYSSLPVAEATVDALDPLERERLRQMIDRYGGDRTLLSLKDEELDGALGLVRREGEQRVPTVAGLLVIGRESAIREHLPTHETAFQVLEGTQVRVNDFYRTPLLKTFERMTEQMEARVEEDEIQVGLFRVPIPTFDKRSYREALLNALMHRDYTRLGAVHMRWESDGLVISNPGGFVEGVTLENLLVVEPKPRNPLLADVIKRIGLVERTGRGVDTIFQGLLRYGRPAPDYSRSDSTTIVVRLSNAEADIPFLQMILEEEKRTGAPIPFEALMVLAQLQKRQRLSITDLAAAVQQNEAATQKILKLLISAGLIQARRIGKERVYTLSRKISQQLGQSGAIMRQMEIESIAQEQQIVNYVITHGKIKRNDVVELCKIGPYQASRLLNRLSERGLLRKIGERKNTFYVQN